MKPPPVIPASPRDFMRPGRSPARAMNAMAATSHPLATVTALDILRKGGNAVDAAIAACAVLAIAEPHQTGLGGDCFALIAPRGTDRIIAYNGSGRAPAAADRVAIARRTPEGIDPLSADAVTVPGAVEAWARLAADHGRLGLAACLEPAIAHAEAGVPVHDRVAFDWRVHVQRIRHSPDLAAHYLSDGVPHPAGHVLRYPRLAETLRRVADEGAAGFYAGPVAQDIVTALNRHGGVHTLEDLAGHRGEYVIPISAAYRGYTVYQCPPNGQGVVALLLLGLLDGLKPDGDGPLGRWRGHSLVEAARLAYAMRDEKLADPVFSPFDWAPYLLPGALHDRARTIRPDARLDGLRLLAQAEHRDTVYLTVVDEERNAVSFINSLFGAFGSTICAPQAGVVLHNRGLSFSLEAGHPNVLVPGKRPMHTIIPAMLTRAGRAVMSFGVMGGHYQPTGHAYLLSNMLDYGLDLQAATDLPRYFPQDGKVWLESGVGPELRTHLAGLGHELADRVEPIGGTQAIWIDAETGVLTGASDPRKDGCAAGY